ncbi:MAG: mechanosensitive ion channel domain-containing protein [Roseobacter sp.]
MKHWFFGVIATILALLAPAALMAQQAAPSSEAQQLIDLLENPEAREALIDSLRNASAPEDTGAIEAEDNSAGRFIAELTSETIQATVASITRLWTAIMNAPDAFDSLSAEQLELLFDALQGLAVVIATTVAVYLILRIYFRRTARRIGAQTKDKGVLRRISMLLAVTSMDALFILITWGAGYLAALFLHGQSGDVGVRQALYLNAFLIVGLAKVMLRAVLSPVAPELRFLALPDAAAKRMAKWFGVIMSVLGYGQLLIVPIVNRQASLEAGRGISTLLALLAILIAATLTVRSRHAVASWFLTPEAEAKPGVARFVARRWHIPVLLYLLSLFLIVAARPDGLIWPVLLNSAEVVGILIAGGITIGILTQFMAKGVRLPEPVSERLPALEGRLNAIVPTVLFVVRGIVVAAVLVFSLATIEVVNLSGVLFGSGGQGLLSTAISVSVMLLIGFSLWLILVSWVDYRLNPHVGSVATSREQTLLSLFKNAATIVLMVILLMVVLSEMGVDIAPLIASAGVLGLAIGFGAQKLVQDIITGIFIQLENMMNVGDVVTLGGTSGVVEKLTIRSVSLRDVHGVFHVIPFSSVDMVSNYVKDYGMFVADIGIAYRESVQDGKEAMMAAFEELRQTEFGAFITGDIQWFGVQTLGDSAVVLRARIKCVAGQQWAIGREYNEICKRIMDERGIEIPYPHQTLYFGENKDGTAPALHVAATDAKPDEG